MFSVSKAKSGGVSGRNNQQIERDLDAQLFCWMERGTTGFHRLISKGFTLITPNLDVSPFPSRYGTPMTRGTCAPTGLPLPRMAVSPSWLTGGAGALARFELQRSWAGA